MTECNCASLARRAGSLARVQVVVRAMAALRHRCACTMAIFNDSRCTMPKYPASPNQWTYRVGQLVGWGLILGGVMGLWGIWTSAPALDLVAGGALVLTGWFSHHAPLRGLVHDLQPMGTHVPIVPPNITISNLVKDYVLRSEEKSFPVIANDQLVGLVSLQDALAIPRDRWETTEVGEIMSSTKGLAIVEAKEVQWRKNIPHISSTLGTTVKSNHQGAKQ